MADDDKAPVRRVTPNPDKPRLPMALERKLAPLDEKSARHYDALERAGEDLEKLIQSDDGAAPVDELEVGDSLVWVLTKK